MPCSPLLFKRILMYPLLSRSLELYPQVTQNAMVNSIYFDSEFLVGGGKAYKVTDGYESAWAVELQSACKGIRLG